MAAAAPATDLPLGADLSRWRLITDGAGRQAWYFYAPGEEPPRPQSFAERYAVGQRDVEDELPAPATPLDAARNAMTFYAKLQDPDDGHWAMDYGGPMFLLPGLVIVSYITGSPLEPAQAYQILRYLRAMQRADGGWGLHIEGATTVFGTSLTYVTARLLGAQPDEDWMVRGRQRLHALGGPTQSTSWGKLWLCTLGLYDWNGINPIPPELWLLPYWAPIHPGRWWCHCRIVYLPMGYLYGARVTAAPTPLLDALRTELYPQRYESIQWRAVRCDCSDADRYTPLTFFARCLFAVTDVFERLNIGFLRRWALRETLMQIKAEDENTKYIDIGPVNKTLNCLSVWHAEGRSADYHKHIEKMRDYLWLGVDGMKMQGYNGSQLWDCAFSMQAIYATGLYDEFSDMIRLGYHYIDVSQVREDVPNPERFYRHISNGAWPFSTAKHGWPITDCTSEGLKAALSFRFSKHVAPLETYRYYAATNVILSLQNSDGGWATYELKRGPDATELLNPSEAFSDIMVDYSYVECTSACVQALVRFRQAFPDHRAREISLSISRGIRFIESKQRDDGSFYGSWAVCFTYGCWFALEAFAAVGRTVSSCSRTSRCVQFLLSKQNADGGWGESFESCVQKIYVPHPDGSQVVNTSWALLGLMAVRFADASVLRRGIDQLRSKQLPNGDWVQEGISGVFNKNCAISYSAYKNFFPIWSLGVFANAYGNKW